MKKEIIFYNAHLVLPDRDFIGSLCIWDNKIQFIDEGSYSITNGINCEGDFIIPGLIELHTDNLEKYIMPRPGVYWPSITASIIAHDNQVFCSGITTVFDALALGYSQDSLRSRILDSAIKSINDVKDQNLLKADHFLHYRCELPSRDVFDIFESNMDNPLLKLVSIMDHTPGQRQWRNLESWLRFHENNNWTKDQINSRLDELVSLQNDFAEENEIKIINICSERDLPVASHDDTTEDHCIEAAKYGIYISEFPTTLEAARKAGDLGMKTVMGSPNMVRGGSHSGNVSAIELAKENLLDSFSSDYMPSSLLHGTFELVNKLNFPLYKAIATVTYNNAKMAKLDDRGSLEVGKNADLVKLKMIDGLPIIKSVWKDGVELVSSNLNLKKINKQLNLTTT